MYRATTPTITFTLPFDVSNIEELSIAFGQKETPYSRHAKLVFEKFLSDCDVDGKSVRLTLSEADTLKLECDKDVEIQLWVKRNGVSTASKVYKEPVDCIMNESSIVRILKA